MADAVVVKASPHPFVETVRRLVASIEGAGFTLFANIDQTAEARRVDLDLRPTTLLLFGNPRGGTPLMAGYPLAALFLPLRFLVWEDTGTVAIGYAPMAQALAPFGVAADDPRVVAMDRALATLSDGVSAG